MRLASFNGPTALALSPCGTLLYVSDTNNHAVRRVELATGRTTTLAGDGAPGHQDGPGAQARLNFPTGLACSRRDGTVYVADANNNRIRMIHPDGTTATLAGSGVSEGRDGIGQFSSFRAPGALCLCETPGHRYEGRLLVTEREGGRVRAVSVPKGGAMNAKQLAEEEERKGPSMAARMAASL